MSIFTLSFTLALCWVLSADNPATIARLTKNTEAHSCRRAPVTPGGDQRILGFPKNPQEDSCPHSVDKETETH